MEGRAGSRDSRAGLLETIRVRRGAIEAYVHEQRPASTRLSTISIISSSVAAALTAGPAFGGTRFADNVKEGLSLEQTSQVWQVLCLGALVVSVTAAVSAQLNKANDLTSRIGAAEAAGVMLDGLRTRLEYGRLPVKEGAEEYQDIVAGIPFVHAGPTDPASGTSGAATSRRRRPAGAWVLGVVAVLAVLLLAAALLGLVRGLAGSSTDPGAGQPRSADARTTPAGPITVPSHDTVDGTVLLGAGAGWGSPTSGCSASTTSADPSECPAPAGAAPRVEGTGP
ncbi:hypothetical protein [Geodermatophilus amargosae]|uniref:hypothetical protein n=1 Tax=Geodermatophilus amargosae TaxID=1296565 RepID=UPI0034E00308